jgi:threonine dehydrogenase-like Zn-dependent dehydrogenase
MKAFCLKEPGVVGWCEVQKPMITPYGAILRPIAVSPCSSDVHTVFGGGSPKAPNLVLGHESIGEIVDVGDMVEDFKVGEIVAIPAITPDWRNKYIQNGNYTHAGAPFSGHQLGRSINGVFAEFFMVPDADTTLAHIPEGVSLEQALMSVDVVATGFTGAESAQVKFGDTVCVIGIGPIGLMAIEGARHLGAGRIIAVGTRTKGIELAKVYGATDIISYKDGDIVKKVMEMTNGIGVDSTIIAGGNDETFAQAVDMTCYGTGNISNINYYGGTGNLSIPKFSGGRGMSGKTIHMELCKGGRTRIERIMSMIQFGRINPEKLVTHHMQGISAIENALYLMKEKPQDLIKVVVKID